MIRNKIFIRSKTINKRNKQAIDLTLWLIYYKVESFLETYEVVDGIRTYVDIPGYSKEKLTHAYAYEGIDLLKEVFKENFDLDIDKYIAGYQTLAFSRIRYTDSAFHREARHREVAESAYKEFTKQGIDTYKRCAEIILNNTKTNISPMEMMNLAYTVLKINDKDIEQFQFPLEEHRKGHIISKQKGWVLEWDKEPNLEAWHKFIFGTE